MAEWEATFARDGVAPVGPLVPASTLDRYRRFRPELIETIEHRWCAAIRAGVEAPNFHDEEDIASLPMLDEFARGVPPSLFGERYRHSHRLVETRLRFVAPYPLGYLNWHVDHSDGPGVYLKMMIYLEDVPAGWGELCYVPGSHLTAIDGTEEMVARRCGYRRYPGRAGTAVAFDTAGVHAPFANCGAKVREALVLSFARW